MRRISEVLLVAVLAGCGGALSTDQEELDLLEQGLELSRSGWTQATASSSSGDDVPARAFDGNLSTRWSTGRAMASGQYFQLNLGGCFAVDRVVMDSTGSPGDHPRGYEIYLSNDGASWGAPVARGNPTGSPVSAAFTATAGKWLRIVQTGSAGNWWSIHELKVYGAASSACASVELPRGGWSASASSSQSAVANAFDGNLSTRWSTGMPMASGQYFQVSLGGCFAVDRVVLDSTGSPGDHPRGYEIYLSSDGASWGLPVATGSPTSSPVSAAFGARAGRWLRIVQTGSSGSWWSIHELRAYGATSSACGSAPPPPPPPPPPADRTLKVVSWNLQHANSPSAQIQKLAELAPDVVLLQELPESVGETFRAGLSARTGATWTAMIAGGNAVMTRRPVSSKEWRDIGPNSWGPNRVGLRVLIDVGGTPLQLFGTHLDWNPDGDMTNHIANRTQLLSWIDGFSGRKIVGGDLNAWTWGANSWEGNTQRETIAQFDARLTDLCSSLRGSHATCNGDPTNGGWRPDYVYRSSGLSSVSYRVVPHGGLSDHNLVVVEVELQ